MAKYHAYNKAACNSTIQHRAANPQLPNSISGCLYQPTHPIGSLKTNKVRFGTTLSASQRHFAM